MSTSRVVVVDLRGGGAPPADVAGGVVVLDHAGSLVAHGDVYLRLLGEDMVTGVVCLAVGEEPDRTDGVVLTVPPALRHACVLWVGDPRGVEWAPERTAPKPVERPGVALDDLVAALRAPQLFDRVVALAEQLGAPAASPGIRLVSNASDLGELAHAGSTVVRTLCAEDRPLPHDLDAALARGRPVGSEGAVLSGRVREAQADAVRRLGHVVALAGALSSPGALFGADRPTRQLGAHVRWAGQAAEQHRRVVVELLHRIDGHLQVGRPSVGEVVELGAPPPWESDGREVAAGLRDVVDGELRAGASLPPLAHRLRLMGARTAPQGCAGALETVRGRGPHALAMPEFRRWPLRLWTAPAVLLGCALVAFLLGPGWPGPLAGVLLALAWFGVGWLLLGRRPLADGEPGLRAALGRALAGYAAPGLLGAVAGALLEVPVPVPAWLGRSVAAVVVLLAAAAAVFGWRAAVRRWRAGLRIAELHLAVEEAARVTEGVVAREWLPVRRRRTTASAASEVAAGLDEVAAGLARDGAVLFSGALPGPRDGNGLRPVPQELLAVVRADLVEVCRSALAPAWQAAENGERTPEGVYAQRVERLLVEYDAAVRREGLLAVGEDVDRARDALMARLWAESPAAHAALRTDVGGEMTQLCRSGQLGYLSTTAVPGLIRFAPGRLRRVLEARGEARGPVADPSVAWGDSGELVGALRLVPLRAESVARALGGVR
ncbi:hypothetical protein [Actinosynnema sp. NPDC020468]|uniref:hypothetical protein n=1 Tax=Actinosynnema sp. NPDC020468 TaxID=3154488 RepID=UPI0033D6CAC0